MGDLGWGRRMLAAALVAAALGSHPAGAQDDGEVLAPEVRAVVEPGQPPAFDPMTATVTVQCAPHLDAHAAVGLDLAWYDVVERRTLAEGSGATDAEGSASLRIDIPVAYPGSWWVTATCLDGPMRSRAVDAPLVVVPTPGGFAIEGRPRTLARGAPTTVGVSGGGCRGVEVTWNLAMHPVGILAEGRAVPDGDGRWSTSAAVTVPVDWPFDGAALQARCVYDLGMWTTYEVLAFAVEATTPRPAEPAPASPSFTG